MNIYKDQRYESLISGKVFIVIGIQDAAYSFYKRVITMCDGVEHTFDEEEMTNDFKLLPDLSKTKDSTFHVVEIGQQ